MANETELRQRFEKCVEDCADSLFRVAFRLTGNRTLASELVQETYLSAWKNISGLNDPQKMRSWLFAILRNQFSKLMRKENRAAPTSDQVEQVLDRSPNEDPSVDRVQTAIATLSEIHKLPVLLVSMEGLTVDEAAKLLDLPRGTVLSRLHRGRQKLKQALLRQQTGVTGNESRDGI